MIIALGPNRRVHTALEVGGKTNNLDTTLSSFSCPICKRRIVTNNETNNLIEYFVHEDGSPDCFENEVVSVQHRIAVEVTVKTLYNRLREVTGEPVRIDVENWIGTPSDFVIADICVASPIKVAAEVFYQSGSLGLRRRLGTMFRHDYRTYLIFHTDSRLNPQQVEEHLQPIAPLTVGRFNPMTLEVFLGDLFAPDQIDLRLFYEEELPRYLMV